MSKKLLIDLIKMRDYEKNRTDGLFLPDGNTDGFRTVRELATFLFTCRKCEEAPCVNVCPADALEKDEKGIVQRAVNLCIRCKSCVYACPFGTLMDDIFEKKEKQNFFDIKDEEELQLYAQSCPEETVKVIDGDVETDKSIYQFNEQVYVKDFKWEI